MKTIERNYRRNPHTASFLLAFHSANGANNTPEALAAEEPETITTYSFGTVKEADDTEALALEAAEDDLLDLVEDKDVVDLRTPRQAELMESLVRQITELDREAGEKAQAYTLGMTEHGKWTAGRDGNASAWISRMIAKVSELRKTAPAQPTTGTATTIPAGRYAVETDEIRCYDVSYGKEGTRWAGFTFLNRISSDDRFPIRNAAEKARILDAIRADVDASAVLAALTLRQCRRCGRTLSDTKNPYFSSGLGPDCGTK
jgi:hypothetical protein